MKTAIVPTEPTESEAAGKPQVPVMQQQLMDSIYRMSTDSNVDVAKMRELLAMRKEMQQEQAQAEFNAAMNVAQSEMTRVGRDAKNSQTSSRYASYAALDRVLRPIYTKNGFALSFDTAGSALRGHVKVMAYVSHRAGFTRTYQADIPADGKGAKGGDVMTTTHAFGAAMSYGSRYLLKLIFNVAVGEDDTDGNIASGPTINAKQVADVEALITEVKADRKKFLALIKADTLEQIPAASLSMVIGLLEAKRKRQ